MTEANLGNGRMLERVATRGKSGEWNYLKPDDYMNRLHKDLAWRKKDVEQMLTGDESLQPRFVKVNGKWCPLGWPTNQLLEYMGLKIELSFIMGNVAEVDKEMRILRDKYLPEELKERYNY